MDITLLKESQANELKQVIDYPKEGTPLVSVYRVELAEGESSGGHMHNTCVKPWINYGFFWVLFLSCHLSIALFIKMFV